MVHFGVRFHRGVEKHWAPLWKRAADGQLHGGDVAERPRRAPVRPSAPAGPPVDMEDLAGPGARPLQGAGPGPGNMGHVGNMNAPADASNFRSPAPPGSGAAAPQSSAAPSWDPMPHGSHGSHGCVPTPCAGSHPNLEPPNPGRPGAWQAPPPRAEPPQAAEPPVPLAHAGTWAQAWRGQTGEGPGRATLLMFL